jgi:hypothetical protein
MDRKDHAMSEPRNIRELTDSADEGSEPAVAGLAWQAILLAALAHSIGWGVRGNWGHEFGAMIPGALSAIAVAITSGREDWRGRVAYFGFFGALGWSLGGSMSYMQVIAYTHSGHWQSQLYGFACLFLMGFLWGAPGGVGASLPAVLDRRRLTEFFVPAIAIFVAWALEAPVLYQLIRFEVIKPEQLDWFDTDWIAAATAGAVSLLFLVSGYRRAASLYFVMAAGWWAGFGGLVVYSGLRMTPPRGDNWAGMLGMTVFMFLYFVALRNWRVVYAGLVVGTFGGLAFAGSTILKIMGFWTEATVLGRLGVEQTIPTNWHSILEQTFGFIAGIGVAIAFGTLSNRSEPVIDEPRARPWTDPFCVGFLLVLVTYLNIRKNVDAVWLPHKIVPEVMYGLDVHVWFNLLYALMAVVVIWGLARNQRRPIALLPDSDLGRGQLLFLFFLWWILVGNWTRDVPFHPQRLQTEGIIHLNACIASLLIILYPRDEDFPQLLEPPRVGRLVWRAFCWLLAAAVVSTALETGVVRLLYGDQHAGQSTLHIRFGEKNTIETGPK